MCLVYGNSVDLWATCNLWPPEHRETMITTAWSMQSIDLSIIFIVMAREDKYKNLHCRLIGRNFQRHNSLFLHFVGVTAQYKLYGQLAVTCTPSWEQPPNVYIWYGHRTDYISYYFVTRILSLYVLWYVCMYVCMYVCIFFLNTFISTGATIHNYTS